LHFQEFHRRFAPFGRQTKYHLLNPSRIQGLAHVGIPDNPGREIKAIGGNGVWVMGGLDQRLDRGEVWNILGGNMSSQTSNRPIDVELIGTGFTEVVKIVENGGYKQITLFSPM
jgi:hypothetical protein